jgi:hypothetical protein
MFFDLLMLMVSGCGTFTSCCAVVSPVCIAAKRLAPRRDPDSTMALELALVGSAFWIVVSTTALFLLFTLLPGFVDVLLGDAAFGAGALVGGGIWLARATLRGFPRVSPELELAIVVDVVSLWRDDQASLAHTERLYRERVLGLPIGPHMDPSRRAAA